MNSLDDSIFADNYRLGDGIGLVQLSNASVRIQRHDGIQPLSLQEVLGLFWTFSQIDGNQDDTLVFVFVRHFFHGRHDGPARTAPGRPEIQNDDVLILVFGQVKFVAIEKVQAKGRGRLAQKWMWSALRSGPGQPGAFVSLLKRNLRGLGEDQTTQMIREKQKSQANTWYYMGSA